MTDCGSSHCWHKKGIRSVVVEKHGPFAPVGVRDKTVLVDVQSCCNCATEREVSQPKPPAKDERWPRQLPYRLDCTWPTNTTQTTGLFPWIETLR